MTVFHGFGTIALVIYVVAFFLRKGHHPIVRAVVDVLFALMFGTLNAYAPMVIYLFYALFAIVPVYRLAANMKLSPKANVLIFQGIPAVIAIAVGMLAVKTQNMPPFGVVITFAFPTIAILLNLVIGLAGASGKSWWFAPAVRSLIWIVYFIVAGIWVSIAYEIFNLVIYIRALKLTGNLPAMSFPKRERATRSSRPKRERPERPTRAPRSESAPLGNNSMSFEADDKNASQVTFAPSVFKGQW